MKTVILFLLVFLILLFVIYNIRENFQDNALNEYKCRLEFKPRGEDLDNCKSICLKEYGSVCNTVNCQKVCNECNTRDCEWKIDLLNKQDKLKPDTVRLKVFSGNKCLKINWVKPYSEFDISKYYIIISSKSDPKRPFFLEIYNLENSDSLIEFFVGNLENNVLYSVFVIAKNKLGYISKPSNTESVITDENSDIKIDIDDKDLAISDSLESKENSFTISREQKPIYQKNVVFNDIKEILLDRLQFKPLNGAYSLNIY